MTPEDQISPLGPPRDELLDGTVEFVRLLAKAGYRPPDEMLEWIVSEEIRLAASCAQWSGVESL